MKEVKAIIQPVMKGRVLAALGQIERLPGITVSDVTGYGRPHSDKPAGPEAGIGYVLVPRTKLEIVVPDDLLGVVLETVTRAAQTGQIDDGKIFVSDVLDAVKIRTGERGSAAV